MLRGLWNFGLKKGMDPSKETSKHLHTSVPGLTPLNFEISETTRKSLRRDWDV